MSSPQLEDGHIRIANELFDAECKVKMSGSEWQVYRVIQRQTYGWSRKSAAISMSFISVAAGLHRPRVVEAINKLIHRNMVVRKNGPSGTNVYEIQKNFSRWKLGRKNGLAARQAAKADYPSPEKRPSSSPEKRPSARPQKRTQNNQETNNNQKSKEHSDPEEKNGATRITEDWHPDDKAAKWIQSFNVTLTQALPIIIEFRQYWLARSQRRKNWSLAFMRNSKVESSLIRMRGVQHGNQRGTSTAECHFSTMQKIGAGGKL